MSSDQKTLPARAANAGSALPQPLGGEGLAEITLRGLLIGVLITLIFTAANVYFGLKAGITFSTSIPAAVISMAILRNLRGATIQENNIVQTVASAAGTLSASSSCFRASSSWAGGAAFRSGPPS